MHGRQNIKFTLSRLSPLCKLSQQILHCLNLTRCSSYRRSVAVVQWELNVNVVAYPNFESRYVKVNIWWLNAPKRQKFYLIFLHKTDWNCTCFPLLCATVFLQDSYDQYLTSGNMQDTRYYYLCHVSHLLLCDDTPQFSCDTQHHRGNHSDHGNLHVMSPTICPDFLWLFTFITMLTECVITHLPCSIIATGIFITTFDNL